MVLLVGGLDEGLTTLVCKEITVVISEGVKTGWNLAEPSQEGYDSSRTDDEYVVSSFFSIFINTQMFRAGADFSLVPAYAHERGNGVDADLPGVQEPRA
jgi:hypothetical protein